MSQSPTCTCKGIKVETPAICRIRVQAHLGGSWLGKLGGMVITSAFKESEQPVTILEGLLLDQAALSDALNAIHELHLELLSVECLNI